jgi:hypothetical protein
MQKLLSRAAHLIFLGLGLFNYLLFGRNSIHGHRAMVYFFCRTGGRFNDWCSRQITLRWRPMALPSKTGLLGDMSGVNGQKVLKQLEEKGFFAFEGALSSEVCERLMKFALATPAVVRRMDGEARSVEPKLLFFDASEPQAVRYDYSVNDLLANCDVQLLLSDPSLLALAEMYLNARPRFDILSMWWHTNYHSQPDSEAAQFYHFDLDRLRWLKVFIYLTDVGPQDGPHSYIEGSHASGGIPQNLLNKGYVRLSDAEVFSNYAPDREICFVAPRGTIILEDTRGLHKGNPVSGNSRLILQLQLSNSLFGAVYPRSQLPVKIAPELADMIRQYRDVYQAYI